ncbi:MAG: sulfatase-like hydrolase/transferase [Alteromonadales bacterium]|nr:sulfatase-like hydrolase/transferase [Alteromonadales bacterium]
MPINLLYSLLLVLLPIAGCLLTETSPLWIMSQLLILTTGLLFLKRFPEKKSRVTFFVIFTLVTHLLNSAYFFSFFLQNQGFNDAFFYHLKPDALFAGVGEYFYLIIFECFHWLLLIGCAIKIALRSPTSLPFNIRLNYLIPVSLIVIYTFHPIYSLQNYALAKLMGNSAFQAQAESIIDDLSGSNVTLTTGKNKPNIVFIYLESVEQAYFDNEAFPELLPELSKIKAKSINFTGLEQANKTSWTIAGMVSSQCGYPLVAAYKEVGANTAAITEEFMINARCHGDLLKENNYWLAYMSGDDHRFAGVGKFYNTHNYDDISDRHKLASQLSDSSYTHGWGLYDDSLFESSYKKFTELSAKNKPFSLTMTTIDTHHPTGHPSKSCQPYPLEDITMLDAVYCTDQLASAYINKIRQSQYSDNTVIVVMNDHLAMRNDLWDRLTSYKSKRNMTFFVNFPDGRKETITSKGTHFDVMPTLYELLGFEVSGQFGFGRSLINQDGYLHHKAGDIAVVKNDLLQDYVSSLWAQKKVILDKTDITISGAGRDLEFAGTKYNIRSDGWGEPASSLFKFDSSKALQEVVTKGWSFDLVRNEFTQRLLATPNDNYLIVSKQKYLHGLIEGFEEEEFVYYFGSASGVESLSGLLNEETITLSWSAIQRVINSNQSTEIAQKRHYSLRSLEDIIEKERLNTFFNNDQPLTIKSGVGSNADSQLVDQSGVAFELQRGLNVYRLDNNLSATYMEVYDGCKNDKIFNKKASLADLVEQTKQQNDRWLVLLGHDAVHCLKSKSTLTKTVTKWSSGLFDLTGLAKISYGEPYLALLDVTSGAMIEVDNSNSASLTLIKNMNIVKLKK